MRIRKPDRFSSFVSTPSHPPLAAAVGASFPDALISDTLAVLGLKSFTESVNPTPNPLVLTHHRRYSEAQSDLPISAANMAGMKKPNDNADDGSDSAKIMQAPPLPAKTSDEEGEEQEMLRPVVAGGEEEIEKLRVCVMNKSPWDVPSFVRAFLRKPTTDDSEQSMQHSRRNNQKKFRIPNLSSYPRSKEKTMGEANQQASVEDDDDFNKTENARPAYNRKEEMKTDTMPCGKEVLQVAKEEQMLELALVRIFREEVGGLTVREAGCKLMQRNANNVTSEGLPLSVQVRRAMVNSPYFVQMDDGKFALWDDFLNTTVGRLDEEENTGAEKDKEMGIQNLDRDENCASFKKPAKELGQISETNLAFAVPKITKGKRSRRSGLGLVMKMRQGEEKEDVGICKQKDGKRKKSCEQAAEQRSYNSACEILLKRNEALHSVDKNAVGSDSQYCHCPIISDGNGQTHRHDLPLLDEMDRAASCLLSFMKGNIGANERRPDHRKRKPVKSRSLKAL